MAPTVQAGRGIPAGRAAGRGGRGMVTLELAFASLGAAAALVLLAWVLSLVMLLAQCQDLAAAVARQEARGDQAAVEEVVRHRPAGARVDVQQHGAEVRVVVELAARPWADWLPAVPLSASAAVQREPT